MASSNSRSSSVSNADSGITSISSSTTVNALYACYWLPSCGGRHEINKCAVQKRDLRGKLGIYYSSDGKYQEFERDQISHVDLRSNKKGCTMVNLLIYKRQNDELWLLFARKPKEIETEGEDKKFLAFPSSKPFKKNGCQKDVAARALESITNVPAIRRNIQNRLQRFLFVDASVIYPLYLTNEDADALVNEFSPNEEVVSIHWFPLSMVSGRLPQWDDYLREPAEGNELAQIRRIKTETVTLTDGDNEYKVWGVATLYLMCIRNDPGFDTFLHT